MASLQEALKSLAPIDYSSLPLDDLKTYLSDSFHHAQLLIDSVPPPPSTAETVTPSDRRSRANTSTSIASNASEISISSARSDAPPSEIERLQKEWGKPYKLKDNPLGITVYKASGKDSRGAWFARRSVHEGLSFTKWKKALQNEFPETLKVQGKPGEGNIRGIGGERRVEEYEVENVGKLEVYHLHAQFPGPTTPRDFVEVILTSDSALSEWSNQDPNSDAGESEIPRHFMVISKPCIHPECPPRDGFIRGQYESVEFIREVPLSKPPKKSASATHLAVNHGRNRSGSSALTKEAILRNAQKAPNDGEAETGFDGGSDSRQRGKTISFAESRGNEAKGEHFDVPREEDESEFNPVEWIMITRSDPGGGIPRFMVERGTPGSIVADASKFLDWACANDLEETEGTEQEINSDTKSPKPENTKPHYNKPHRQSTDLHDYQTNGHLAGLDGTDESSLTPLNHTDEITPSPPDPETSNYGLYNAVAGAVGAAGEMVAAHTPTMIANYIPGHTTTEPNNSTEAITDYPRRPSLHSAISSTTNDSFASALEGTSEDSSDIVSTATGTNPETGGPSSIKSATTPTTSSAQEKALQKLEEKKRKLDEKLAKTREKELSKNGENPASDETTQSTNGSEKGAEALAKAAEKHQKELAKHQEKYQKEIAKIEAKREREERKAEEKRRKAEDKDEKVRLGRELEVARLEVEKLGVEKGILMEQVGRLQKLNTVLTNRVGRLGAVGEEVLREVAEDMDGGKGGSRSRGSSIRGSGDSEKISLGRSSLGGEKGDVVGT